MKILNGSVKDNSQELDVFTKTLHGCNYVVYGDLITFAYDGAAKDFNLDLLRDIYVKLPQKNTPTLINYDTTYDLIDGEIKLSSWNLAVEDINKKLKYTAQGEGIKEADETFLDIISNETYEKRKETFWTIVKNHFNLLPEVVYVHVPYYPSYFHFYVMWGFCYIFLKDGKGLILHAGASD